ncbi:MAG: TRAP transporter fused permease subunit [Roseitalea porphyridii]|jgi:TRAP transporter 4TM/12TM fusion protein|uniref:TRAP transporter permease n=1 Tax=Roseitalea porphyridii TaxID=1852022 RepID=UPI0032F04C9F
MSGASSTQGQARPSGDDVAHLQEIVDPETNFRSVMGFTARFVTVLAFGLSAYHFYTAGFGVLTEVIHRSVHLAVSMALIFLLFSRADSLWTTRSTIATAFFSGCYLWISWNVWTELELAAAAPESILFWLAVALIVLLSLPNLTGNRIAGRGESGIGPTDYLLMIVAASFSLYLIVFFDEIFIARVGQPIARDYLMGALALILVAEATRRTIGSALPAIGMFCLFYAVLGPDLPAEIAHRGFSMQRIINHLYLGTEGIYGVATGVVATFVFHFILFGVVAQISGLGQLFIGLSTAIAGRFSGGPAKVSVVSSSMFGMISGSTVANTVTTGSLTIPLMKKTGFRAPFAGAVEASASAGGQMTPPIMGAAAFVMAESLGVPYVELILIAILPAAFHYLSVLLSVHFEAKRLGLGALPADQIPSALAVARQYWHLALPPIAMVTLLLMRFTPFTAAFWGIILVIVASYIPLLARSVGVPALAGGGDGNALTPRRIVGAFEEGARFTLAITATCACVGFILGTVTLTGIGFKLSAAVLSAAQMGADLIALVDPFDLISDRGAILFCALVLTAMACILMGCGMPTVPLYIILSAIVAPALLEFGVPLLATHFAVFYFGLLSDLTPPFALAAFAGAAVAQADPMRTAFIGFRLSIAKLLVPFMFVYSPALLLIDFEPGTFALALASGILSILSLAVGFTGFAFAPLGKARSRILMLCGLCLVFDHVPTIAVAALVAIAILASNFRDARRAATREV